MIRYHYWRLASWAVAKVEGHTWGGPLRQDLFLDATQVKDMLTLIKLDARFLAESWNHADTAVIILTEVFIELYVCGLIVLLDAVFIKTWKALLLTFKSSAPMPAGQLLVTTLISNFNTFLTVTTVSERWVFATRRFLDLIKTEAASCGVSVTFCLFTSLAKMIWFFFALRAEVVWAVWTADSEFCHVFGCLLGKYVALIVLLLIVYCCGRYLENITTTALNHWVLLAQVDLHSLLLDLLFVLFRSENHPDLNFRNDDVAVRTLGLLKNGFISLAFVSKTNFGCVLFEATNVIDMEALGLHKHAHIPSFLVLLRDLTAAIPTHGSALLIVYKWRLLFFVIVLSYLLTSVKRHDFRFLHDYLRLLLLLPLLWQR